MNKITIADLKSILRSRIGHIDMGVVYDTITDEDLCCASLEYIVIMYGDRIITRLYAENDNVIIEVE